MNKAELLKQQREKDGYNFCQRCLKNHASVGILDEHHIIFVSEKPKHPLLNHSKNKIILCRECHDFYHEVKSRREHLIKERDLIELFGNEIISI